MSAVAKIAVPLLLVAAAGGAYFLLGQGGGTPAVPAPPQGGEPRIEAQDPTPRPVVQAQAPAEVQRTEVELRFVTSPRSIVRLMELTQSDRFGKPLTIADFDVVGARSKSDEVSATLTFYVVRLREIENDEFGGEEV